MVRLLGREVAGRVRETSLRLYEEAAHYAAERGIIIADTKFEFAIDGDGALVLIDEVLTPDSSRFWPADAYRPGHSPPSFDKQFVRDYLEGRGLGQAPPRAASARAHHRRHRGQVRRGSGTLDALARLP